MKKVLLSLFGIWMCLFAIPQVFAEETDLVKVYVFYAGGCSACEAQIEYLEGLESNGVKFEIVEKELYVSVSTWAEGADYELGSDIAKAFTRAGFSASVSSTPLVIISDVYAANGYNYELETIIDEVYEEGDNDVVACYEEGNTDCYGITFGEEDSNYTPVIIVIIVVAVLGCAGLVIVSKKK